MKTDSAGPSLAETYDDLKIQIDERVNQVATSFLNSLEMRVPSEVRDSYLLAVRGGKRFRAFCAIVGGGIGYAVGNEAGTAALNAKELLERSARTPGIMDLAVALEFYQGAALVHDDIIDRSDTRRGRPTTHVGLANHHRRRDMIGSGESFGQDAAILVGDLLLAGADFALAESVATVPSSTASKLLHRYSLMAGEVAAGQYLDAAITYTQVSTAHAPPHAGGSFGTGPGSHHDEQLENTLAVVRSKSARYSVVNPVLLGAIMTETPQPLIETLRRILEPAGVAFQLRDDTLGVTGVEAETGKPTGIDVKEGKRTVLLALTLAHADEQAQATLTRVYETEHPSDQDVQDAIDAIRAFGLTAHEQMITNLVADSAANLAVAGLPDSARSLVDYLASLLVNRTY